MQADTRSVWVVCDMWTNRGYVTLSQVWSPVKCLPGITKRVAIRATKGESRFEVLEFPRQGVRERFGAFSLKITKGLAIRRDDGSLCMPMTLRMSWPFHG